MDIVIWGLGIVATLILVLVQLFYEKHKRTSILLFGVSVLFYDIAGCLLWLSSVSAAEGLNQEHPAPALKRPTFRPKSDSVSLGFGNSRITVPAAMVAEKPIEPLRFGGHSPFRMYLENGVLFVDAKIFARGKPFEITHNNYDAIPPGYDLNSDDGALEIVDEKNIPVFQMAYRAENHIVVNGVFANPTGDTIIVDEVGTRTVKTLEGHPYNLKPIFRYPAWRYPGRRTP